MFCVKGADLIDSGQYKVTSELRWALEQALRHRRPTAFIVDEAQHFKRIASGRRLLDQMDTIKSLANLTGITHVLIGTYELLGFSQLSAQLDRRSCEIHFPRYHIDVPEEMLAFKRILLTFQRHLPLMGEPDCFSVRILLRIFGGLCGRVEGLANPRAGYSPGRWTGNIYKGSFGTASVTNSQTLAYGTRNSRG